MKKPYQIESQRAVKRLEEMAAEGNPAHKKAPEAGPDAALGYLVGALIEELADEVPDDSYLETETTASIVNWPNLSSASLRSRCGRFALPRPQVKRQRAARPRR